MGVVTSYWFLAIVLLVALITEYNDKYVATAFFTGIGLVSAYLLFNLSTWMLVAYVPAGMVWSFWRWRVYTKNCAALAKEGKLEVEGSSRNGWKEIKNPSKEKSREALVQATLLLPNLDRIISWIICFPISIIESAVDDFIHVLKIAITEWFAKVYRMSTESALKDFDKEDEQ